MTVLLQSFFWGIPVAVIIVYAVVLLFIVIAKKDKYITAFLPLLIALFTWATASLLMKMDFFPGVVFWNRIMAAAMYLIPIFTYHFLIVYSNTKHGLDFLICSGFVLVAQVCNFLGYIILNPRMVTTVVTEKDKAINVAEFVYEVGPAMLPTYLMVFLTLIYIFIRVRSLVKNGKLENCRANPFLFGLSIMFLGVLTNLIPTLGKYPFDILMSFVNALVLLSVIYKNRLLELRFVVTRGLVFYIVFGSLTAIYTVLIIRLESLALGIFGSSISHLHIFVSLALALVFQPLYMYSKKLVDKLFYYDEYNRRQALKTFSLSVANQLDLNDIFTQLTNAIQSAFSVKKVYMLLRDPATYNYISYKNGEVLDQTEFTLSRENPIISWFVESNNCLTISDLHVLPFFKAMWAEEHRQMKDINAQVIIPLKCRGELIGLIILSAKESKLAYTEDDLDLLSSLAFNASIAIDNARMFKKAQEEAIVDDLTTLYNYRYFRRELDKTIRDKPAGEHSLIIIDIDMFKLYNDLYGHVEGDKALQTIAGIMKRTVGAAGSVCRYGGEEFTVIMPGADAKKAYETAEKLRIAVQECFLSKDEEATQQFLTVSIGVCSYPISAGSPEEMIRNADIAGYKAKHSGKNQTVVYTPALSDGKFGENIDNAIMADTFMNYRTNIYALTAAIDAKDHYTFGHSQKVAQYAKALAHAIGLDDTHVEIVYEAGLLHDIGKIGIPENILTKTEALTKEEFEIMKRHVDLSITIVKHLPSMNHVIPAIVGHHERWDGKGYPRGIKGSQIPIGARCLAVADAFDAIVSARPYKDGRDVEFALAEILDKAGTQFDPDIAPVFVRLVRTGKITTDYNLVTI